jgi:membrane protein implicated in regulation of membrane protease activity
MFTNPRAVEHLGGEALGAAGKVSPGVAYVAGSAAGLTLDQWVAIATLVYLALQTALLVWKFFRDRRGQVKSDG